MSKALACAVAIAVILAASSASARLIELKLGATEPFVEGRVFGETGAYVRLKGTARGELDPKAPEHADIVGLDRAPRNARGMVEYEVDVFILRPADPAFGHFEQPFLVQPVERSIERAGIEADPAVGALFDSNHHVVAVPRTLGEGQQDLERYGGERQKAVYVWCLHMCARQLLA